MNAITNSAQAMVEESRRSNGKAMLTYRQALGILHAQVCDTLFPEAAPSATPSVALRLECCLNPAMPIGHAAQALPDALDALRRAGVSAQVLRVEQRGLGDAYLNALERALSIPVTALAR